MATVRACSTAATATVALVCLLGVSSWVGHCSAHGMMTQPAARNWLAWINNNYYWPDGANAGGEHHLLRAFQVRGKAPAASQQAEACLSQQKQLIALARVVIASVHAEVACTAVSVHACASATCTVQGNTLEHDQACMRTHTYRCANKQHSCQATVPARTCHYST